LSNAAMIPRSLRWSKTNIASFVTDDTLNSESFTTNS